MISSEPKRRETLSKKLSPALARVPDVSVVVACHNDAQNLPRAVGSVLTQSLRTVEVIISDDCSTDNTEEVANALVRSDGRVRYIRQQRNSGAAGAPRNDGVSFAAAPFVMFLDSDDELERHACYNLLAMARAEHCEVVAGKCKRHHLATDTWTTWYPKLYRDRRILTDVEQEPEFVFDSNSTAKLYRKSFLEEQGLTFPEGVKYEDLHFTAQVYAAVNRLGVIPETVYHWRIYPVEVRQSITQQRNAPQNLADRLHAIASARDLFAEQGKELLFETLLVKFLAHDARITVEDAGDTDDERLREHLLDLVEPDLRAVPWHLYQRIPTMDRVALGMALMRNRAGIQQAKMTHRNRGAVAGRLISHNGRRLWAPWSEWSPPKEGSLEEFLTDLTHEPIRDTPAPLMRLAHNIRGAEVLPRGGARLHGTTHDPFLKFSKGRPPEMTLRLRLRGSKARQQVPIEVKSVERGRIHWEVDLARFVERSNQLQVRWWLDIETRHGGLINHSELCLDTKLGDFSFPEPQGAIRHLGSRIRLYPTRLGDAALRRELPSGRASRAALVLHRVDRLRQKIDKRVRRFEGKARLRAYRLARRRPVLKNTVLFDSHMGKQYSDNPRAIYEEMLRRDTGFELLWDFLDPEAHPEYHGRSIKRHTRPYARLVARAGIIVDNQGLPIWATKRQEQFHLQTWHGTPLKRMALHKLENLHASPATVDRITKDAAWDALISPSDYFERTFVDSYRYSGPLIRGGSPRNDVLINHPEPDPELVRSLDLPRGKAVVLYAPTFREGLRNSRRPANVLLDLERWIAQMGDSHYLLLRSHYLNKFTIKSEHAPFVMDVSNIEEISDLYRVADVLVTDYSSVMFDYIWLNKPIVIYAPDYENYTQDTRGTYFDLRDDAPGPFCETQCELHDLIHAARNEAADARETRESFRARYCGVEDGRSAARAVDYLLSMREARG